MPSEFVCTLGDSIPPLDPHALSVSLPTWSDNVRWASGDEAVINEMTTGYPRFFIHRTIQKLATMCLEIYPRRLGITRALALLFPTARTANECVAYIRRHFNATSFQETDLDVIRIPLPKLHANFFELHMVTFPPGMWKLAKSFWQHAGVGISSRYAEICLLSLTGDCKATPEPNVKPFTFETLVGKAALRRRIAVLAAHGENSCLDDCTATGLFPVEDDVFLYPTGMSAIWHAHQLLLSYKPGLKSVCFGFPYTDTLKILQKWGPGCYLFGDHMDKNLTSFESFLDSPSPVDSDLSFPNPSLISGLYCECPSNPLLQSPDLPHLRRLADRYGFLIIVDDTIGGFVNVDVLQYADVVTTSLSKLFSGKANAMGGSLVLNPKSQHYSTLKRELQSSYVDDYFPPDAIQMEVNSRDFVSRVHVINSNTRAVCRYLRSRSLTYIRTINSALPFDASRFVIKEVFYPEWVTRENFDLSRRPEKDDNFGPLFSLTFVSLAASEAFYNTLPCSKGPSLGTNFTLACPYTILAHFLERSWAAEYGVEEGIVRVSVGLEDIEVLMEWFQRALKAAESILDFSMDHY